MYDKNIFSYGGIFMTKKIFFEFLVVWNLPLVIVNIFMIVLSIKSL